ncbi:hypothetical protein ACA097_19415 [Pseudomonas sp. QL9]|uniref:hypothetical protein n=1 Tax=Pseudomonas sp. QL9 TaxID=3242725 RepID=UPI00352B2F1A
MILNKIVIGVSFNAKIFRLASLAGVITDKVIAAVTDKKGDGLPPFIKVGGVSELQVYQLGFATEDDHNTLHIDTGQVIYTRSSPQPGTSALNLDSVIEEFSDLWKLLNGLIEFPGARRIGLVGEFLLSNEGDNSSASLISKFSKFPVNSNSKSTQFMTIFDEMNVISPGEFNHNTSEFWNCIYSIYNSERDEVFKLPGRINTNIDVQRYYNPAKTNVAREVRVVKDEFLEKRRQLKERLKVLELD